MSDSHLAILFVVVVLVMGLATCGRPHAQDGHREHHDWYRGLLSPQGFSCCSGDAEHGDCSPAAVWRDANGRVWARLNGATISVPAAAVLPDRMNLRPLTGHLCQREGFVYCALVGGAGG